MFDEHHHDPHVDPLPFGPPAPRAAWAIDHWLEARSVHFGHTVEQQLRLDGLGCADMSGLNYWLLPPSAVPAIAAATSEPVETLTAMIPSSVPGLLPWVATRGSASGICPLSVAAGRGVPSLGRHWAVNVCPNHGLLLADVCLSCGQPFRSGMPGGLNPAPLTLRLGPDRCTSYWYTEGQIEICDAPLAGALAFDVDPDDPLIGATKTVIGLLVAAATNRWPFGDVTPDQWVRNLGALVVAHALTVEVEDVASSSPLILGAVERAALQRRMHVYRSWPPVPSDRMLRCAVLADALDPLVCPDGEIGDRLAELGGRVRRTPDNVRRVLASASGFPRGPVREAFLAAVRSGR